MKKQIIVLSGLLLIGQSHAMHNTLNAQAVLTKLYAPTRSIAITDITYTWLKNLNTIINSITEEAMTKSKDIVGEQSTTLITTATTIRDITRDIITLYVNIKQNVDTLRTNTSVRSEYETRASYLIAKLSAEKEKINKTYVTVSKKQAQKLLQDTIDFLKSPLLTDIEQELQLLNPSYFA